IRNNNGNVGHRAVYISGTCASIEMSKCNLYSSGYGLLSGSALTGGTFDYINVTGGANIGIYMFGAASSNVTVTNCTTTNRGGIQLTSIANPIANNNTVTSFTPTLNGIGVQSCSGILTMNDNRISNGQPTNGGIYLLNNTFTSGTCDRNILSSITGGPVVISNTHDISVNNTIVYNSTSTGFVCNAGSYNITLYGCLSYNNAGDGFNTATAHDITFIYCRSSHCGNKASQAAGDGFSSHLNDYNINHLYCIADYNTVSGFAMVGNTSGLLYGCLAYKNAGDWTSEGGLDQIRSGFDFNVDGVNPTTGISWKIRNCIGYNNYPRELRLYHIEILDFDFNQYYGLDINKFVSLSGGGDITFETYQETYEANSIYGDPVIKSDSELYPTIPIEIGETLDAAFDDGMDVTTNWGSLTSVPTVVTKQQSATWQIGAYIV
ncbi:MAG: right-handed parallel beta-helix repeat-containing protein, partial [Bacteroidales bacterium]